jgi:hypothetical protein
MKKNYEIIRKAAFKHLYLIYVKSSGAGMYHLTDSDDDGAVPVLADYIGIQFNSSMIKVKDAGSNIIYLVDSKRFKKSRLELLLKHDPGLENKLKVWFPFLWGEGTADDFRYKYFSIIRQLEGYADIAEPLEGFNLEEYKSEAAHKKIESNKNKSS